MKIKKGTLNSGLFLTLTSTVNDIKQSINNIFSVGWR